MQVLVLGASGMLGSTMYRYLSAQKHITVYGTTRSFSAVEQLARGKRGRVLPNVDVRDADQILQIFTSLRPDVVINCVGIIKQLADINHPLTAIPINSMIPHRLAALSSLCGARFIHFSTDCVFSGSKGMYCEYDLPDPVDLYGYSKLMGEIDRQNAITLRTSLIGHELTGNRSLLEWFLSQTGSVKGFRKVIFSGLPTVEIARIVYKFVLPNTSLQGLYHLSADPVSKYELLCLIANIYNKNIDIIADDACTVDRSLDSSRFREAVGYRPQKWPLLIKRMRDFG